MNKIDFFVLLFSPTALCHCCLCLFEYLHLYLYMVCCVYSVAANSEKKRRKTIHNCLAASYSFFLLLSSGAYEWIASLEIFLDSSSFFSSCPALPSLTYLHHQVGYKLNEKLPLSMSIFALLPKSKLTVACCWWWLWPEMRGREREYEPQIAANVLLYRRWAELTDCVCELC